MPNQEMIQELMRKLSEKKLAGLGEQPSPDIISPEVPVEEMPEDVPLEEPVNVSEEDGAEDVDSRLEEIRRRILGDSEVAEAEPEMEPGAKREALMKLLQRMG